MNKELMNFEGKEVEVFEFEGKVLFNPRHVGEVLGMSAVTVRRHVKEMNPNKKVFLTNSEVYNMHIRKLNNRGENFLTEDGLILLVQKCNANIQLKNKILRELLGKDVIAVSSRDEDDFINILEKVLKPFNLYGIKQFKVMNYRIDFYIPKLKIGIEYDENEHKHYKYEQQELREEKIKNYLDCNFIRVSDKNDHAYNIGLVMRKLYTYLLKNNTLVA